MIESLKSQHPVKKRNKRLRKLESAPDLEPEAEDLIQFADDDDVPAIVSQKASKPSAKPAAKAKPAARVPAKTKVSARRDRGESTTRSTKAPRRHYFLGLVTGSLAALVLLALVSEAGPLWAGPLGHKLAALLLRPLGILAFGLPIALGTGAATLLGLVRHNLTNAKRAAALLGGGILALAFVAIVHPSLALFGYPLAGTWLTALAAPIASALSPVGGGLITFTLAFACFSVVSNHSLWHGLVALAHLGGRGLAAFWGWARGAMHTAVQEHREARANRYSEFDRQSLVEAGRSENEDEAEKRARLNVTVPDHDSIPELGEDEIETQLTDPHGRQGSEDVPEILLIGEDARVRGRSAKSEVETVAVPPPPPAEALADARGELAVASAPVLVDSTTILDPAIVDASFANAPKRKRGGAFALQKTGTAFKLPSLDLLEVPPDVATDIDRSALTDTAQKLTQKLADFGIKGRVETIRPGPVITMYEFVPAPGIRVSKIASLADDLAMAMEALQVRIVAPIPGKNVVGIEVPNRARQKVYLREILEDDGFVKMTSPLTLAFGKDTEGSPYVGDLSRMPHLLVAGTTGSGKSVAMNSMIMSLLFKATPEDVRMIMIDPKMVELSMYDGIPHLLLPVVQDAQKAPLALKWAVEEMERRYHLIGKLRVKDLKGYNEKVQRLKQGEKLEEPIAEPPKKVLIVDVANGETEEEVLARASEQTPTTDSAIARAAEAIDPSELEKLPYIVIIIDELADLMMVASRDVEQSIARLAAKARAAGIHIVIATQRPSTDVISGVIKANLPVRIAFRLASRHDSATIINGPGAERLLGEGDMLHIPPGCSDAQRLHGAWVRESEIERIVDFWKGQGKPVYDEEILRPRAEERDADGEESVPDELYDQAIAVVCQLERVSISLLQRKMGVGYNRAADLIERLEREGAIGPANGIKPREVLIKPLGEARI